MSAAKLLVVLIQILIRPVYSTDIDFHMTCTTKQLPHLTSIHSILVYNLMKNAPAKCVVIHFPTFNCVLAETYMYTVSA